MFTAYDAFAFSKAPLKLALPLIKHSLAAIRYGEFSEKILYCVEHGYREQSNVKGDIVLISSQES